MDKVATIPVYCRIVAPLTIVLIQYTRVVKSSKHAALIVDFRYFVGCYKCLLENMTRDG